MGKDEEVMAQNFDGKLSSGILLEIAQPLTRSKIC